MLKKMTGWVAALLICGGMSFAAGKARPFLGIVSDSRCAAGQAGASSVSAACVKNCVAHGAKYVLINQGKIYQLQPQAKFAKAAGKRVKITGRLKGNTIEVSTVTIL
jgi:hypothetical protein